VMKMADGGFRPAFNGQFATDTKTQVILGVGLSNAGNDMAQMTPMLDQLKERYGRLPGECLVDGGFVDHGAIADAAKQGCTVYAPVNKPRDGARDPHAPLPGD